MQKKCVLLRLVGLATAAVMAATVPTRADDSPNQTAVNLPAPVQIPGMTLQAGAYLFETSSGQGGRHSVRVYSSDRSKLITTVEAVPMKRNGELADLVELRPTILGSAPTALKGWLRPASADGYQFVYPAREAATIANRTDTPVVASVAESGKDAQLVVIDAYGNRSPWPAGS